MDHWRSHIPKINLPKQGDRKWQQDEQELRFELASDFFGRKKECVVVGISGGDPRGVHKVGGAPSTLVGTWLLPLLCFQCQIFSNVLEKIIFNFEGIWRTFIFGVFFIAWIIQKIDRKMLFLLYLI